MIRNTN